MGTLYIVSSPIGNLQDITLRAVEVLQKATVIACEDTRRTGLLLQYINNIFPNTKGANKHTLVSYFEQNEAGRMPQILTFLRNDTDVALVSDAGTPTVSDPGFKLVRTCVEEGIKVVSIPGASSILAGIGKMNYMTFLSYNIVGAILWAIGLPLAGFLVGGLIPSSEKYLELIIFMIIFLSLLPAIVPVIKDKKTREAVIKKVAFFCRI